MLKKTITYVDFDGNTQKEDYYFHLNEIEIAEMEYAHEGGLTKTLERIVAENDNKKIIEIFKSLILMSVGEKSLDGKRFVKNSKIREDFESTPAYTTLFVELANDADAAAAFVNGIIPAAK